MITDVEKKAICVKKMHWSNVRSNKDIEDFLFIWKNSLKKYEKIELENNFQKVLLDTEQALRIGD